MTTEIEVVVDEVEGKVVDVEVSTTPHWRGKHLRHSLNERVQSIAAGLAELGKEDGKGSKYDRKTYYKLAEQQGLTTEGVKAVERFNEDYAVAVHAVSSDRALDRFSNDKAVEEYAVTADIGEHTRYRDNYRRFDSRSVSAGVGGERRVVETHGYHNPVIRTEFKEFESNRQSVHSLAKDLLG